MKINIIIVLLSALQTLGGDPPKISVNYPNKKQWKLSKHDLADIKIDIEREMRTKVLQIQMDWENRQRMEQQMVYNQFSPVMSPPFFQPSMYPQLSPVPAVNLPTHINNYPRFQQREVYMEEPSQNYIDPPRNEDDNLSNPILFKQKQKIQSLGELALKTIEEIKRLKEELGLIQKNNPNQNGINERPSDLVFNITRLAEVTEPIRAQAARKVKSHLEENYGVNGIINKYRSHQADKEINLFSYIFKNFSLPSIKHIDIKDVGDKIKHAVDSNTIDEDILQLKSLGKAPLRRENERKNLRRTSDEPLE